MLLDTGRGGVFEHTIDEVVGVALVFDGSVAAVGAVNMITH